jgi:pyruvate dehydrogenase E2 component (dihydrolipoamide acetyltransferase)
MGMTEAVILQWLKSEGDEVAEGEDLVEVDAAKAVDTIVAPVGGVLTKILAQADDEVPVPAMAPLVLTRCRRS